MKCLKISILAAILICIGRSTKEENTIIDTVQAGLSAVNEATNPTVNALETLKVITKESAEFLRLVGPVGAFISVAAKTYFQPESPELQALKLFHEQSNKNYKKLDLAITSLRQNINFDALWLKWSTYVQDSIRLLQRQLDRLTKTSKPAEEFVAEFKRLCVDPNRGPESILNFIYGRTVDDCYRGCEELPRIWLELDDLMTDVMMKINHWAEWNEDAFNTTKFNLQVKLASIGCSDRTVTVIREMRGKLNQFHRFSNVSEAVREIEESQPVWFRTIDPPGSCSLNAAIVAGDWNLEFVNNFIEIVRIGVEQTVTSAMYCSNLAYNDDQPTIDNYRATIQETEKEILNHTYNYTIRILRMYWPEVAVQIARRYVLSHSEYTKFPFDLSFSIKSTLDRLGYDPFVHQVVISRPYETPVQFYVGICNPVYCNASIYLFHGFNVILTRIDKLQLRLKAAVAKSWCNTFCSPVETMISDNYDIDELKSLSEKVQGEFYLNDNFNTVLYFRNYRFNRMPHLDTSTAGAWELNFDAWHRVSYKYAPPIYRPTKDYERFEILFLV